MRIRLLSVAAIAALAAALPAGAAPAPQITDPAGDAKTQSAGADIVSVLFGTTGTSSKVGRKTVYTPNKLVVNVTYSAAPSTDPYVSHQVTFTAPGCGTVYLEIYSGGTFGTADCLPEDSAFDISYKAAGNVLSFSLPFNTIGKQYFKSGSSLTDLVAYTALADPVLGYESQEIAGLVGDGSIDYATSGKAFKI